MADSNTNGQQFDKIIFDAVEAAMKSRLSKNEEDRAAALEKLHEITRSRRFLQKMEEAQQDYEFLDKLINAGSSQEDVLQLGGIDNFHMIVKTFLREEKNNPSAVPKLDEDSAITILAALNSEEPQDWNPWPDIVLKARTGSVYRTKTAAKAAGAITKAPKSLAIPTYKGYLYSFSLYQEGNAYLQPLKSADGLRFENGQMFFEGTLKEVSAVELQNMKTKDGIENIDLQGLRMFYSLILSEFEKSGYTELKDVQSISVPVLAEYMGLDRNGINKTNVQALINRTQSYHHIIGVLHGSRPGRLPSLYPVLNFEGYDEKTNIIRFSSPYMNHVIKTVFEQAIRKTRSGDIMTRRDGVPLLRPWNTYSIDPSISKEKNKAAVENVIIIVQGVKGAGKCYHISAKTLVERNVQLSKRLEDDPRHRGRILQRTFRKTWELLRTKTKLLEEGYVLPDPDNPKNIPTGENLDEFVYEFKRKA